MSGTFFQESVIMKKQKIKFKHSKPKQIPSSLKADGICFFLHMQMFFQHTLMDSFGVLQELDFQACDTDVIQLFD